MGNDVPYALIACRTNRGRKLVFLDVAVVVRIVIILAQGIIGMTMNSNSNIIMRRNGNTAA